MATTAYTLGSCLEATQGASYGWVIAQACGLHFCVLLREPKPLLTMRVGAAGGRFARSQAKVLGYNNVHNLAACLLRAAYGNLAILNCLLLCFLFAFGLGMRRSLPATPKSS